MVLDAPASRDDANEKDGGWELRGGAAATRAHRKQHQHQPGRRTRGSAGTHPREQRSNWWVWETTPCPSPQLVKRWNRGAGPPRERVCVYVCCECGRVHASWRGVQGGRQPLGLSEAVAAAPAPSLCRTAAAAAARRCGPTYHASNPWWGVRNALIDMGALLNSSDHHPPPPLRKIDRTARAGRGGHANTAGGPRQKHNNHPLLQPVGRGDGDVSWNPRASSWANPSSSSGQTGDPRGIRPVVVRAQRSSGPDRECVCHNWGRAQPRASYVATLPSPRTAPPHSHA